MSNPGTLRERREAAMGPAYRLFYRRPLEAVSARGVWIEGRDGIRYLDVYNNVPVVGHCHPRVVDALARQAATYNSHTRYLHQGTVAFAERLTALFPAPMDTAMFTCSGTEANELALRVARVTTGNAGVIVTANAYHGNSWAIAQISTEDDMGETRGPHVAPIQAPVLTKTNNFADNVRQGIDALRSRGLQPAALIVDTVFSSEGICTPPVAGLAEGANAVRDAGGLFIADEVQAGFGRLGSHLWGFQTHAATPDIVTLGKPMGNGFPVAGMISRQALLHAFSERTHYFNTFGGSPLACAAANAVLDVLESEGLRENAQATGSYLGAGLADLARGRSRLGPIRGTGLFLGMDVLDEEGHPDTGTAEDIAEGLRDRGVLIGRTGPAMNTLKFRPPLVFAREHAELLIERFEETLDKVFATAPRIRKR